jgi:hypothetical protein
VIAKLYTSELHLGKRKRFRKDGRDAHYTFVIRSTSIKSFKDASVTSHRFPIFLPASLSIIVPVPEALVPAKAAAGIATSFYQLNSSLSRKASPSWSRCRTWPATSDRTAEKQFARALERRMQSFSSSSRSDCFGEAGGHWRAVPLPLARTGSIPIRACTNRCGRLSSGPGIRWCRTRHRDT